MANSINCAILNIVLCFMGERCAGIVRKAVVFLGIAVWSAIVVVGCSPTERPGSNPSSATELPPVKASARVVAEGVVRPRQYAALSMLTSGIVAEVLVKEGDVVAEGHPLIRLENRSQRAAVSEAEAAVRAAEARLQEAKSGAREQEVEAARARLDGAKARLARLLEDPRSSDLAAAQAAVDEARAALKDLLDGPSADQIAEAAARRANAAAALQQAQAAYDKVKWFDGAGLLPESLQLQKATNDYEAADAVYQSLINGATEAEIAAAQARVRRAEAELEKVKQSARASEIAEAESEVRRSQAELDLLLSGTRPEQIARAEADVVAAYAALRRAQAALADTELRAPFSGAVAWLNTRVGELVSPGQVVVQLADLSSWVIETDDLTEIEVVGVQVGAPATITFDAIPGLELPGQVKWIRPFGEKKEGDITYTVVVCPDEEDPRLRWNMTAVVSIELVEEPLEGFSPECPTPDTPAPSSEWTPPARPAPTMAATQTEPVLSGPLSPTDQPSPRRTSPPTRSATVTADASIEVETLTVSAELIVEVLASRLNVRAGPNVGFPTIGYLDRGQELPVLRRDADSGWLQIPFADGPEGKGWVTDREPYVRLKRSQP